MPLFKLIDQNNAKAIEDYVTQNPEVLAAIKSCKDHEGDMTVDNPLQYALSNYKAEAFGVLYRHAKQNKVEIESFRIYYEKNFSEAIQEAFLAQIPKEDKEYDHFCHMALNQHVKYGKISEFKKLAMQGRGFYRKTHTSYEKSIINDIIETDILNESQKCDLIHCVAKAANDVKLLNLNTYPDTYSQQACQRGQFQIVATLLELGCNMVCGYKSIFEVVFEKQWRQNKPPQTVLVRSLVQKLGANLQGFLKRTPLFFAIEYNDMAGAKCLMEMGADLTARDEHDSSLLEHAAIYFKSETMTPSHLDLFEKLCQENQVNNSKSSETALHSAVWNQNLPLIQMLIKHKADVNAVNSMGFAPIDYLMNPRYQNKLPEGDEKDRQEILRILKENGAIINPVSEAFMDGAQRVVQDIEADCKEMQAQRMERENQLIDHYSTAINNKIETDISVDPQKFCSMLQYKKVLWSLTQRHSKKFMNNLIFSQTAPRRRMHFEDITLEFYDLSDYENYEFIVHTTNTHRETLPSKLAQIAQDDPTFFIKTTSFFSGAIVNKQTPIPKMTHQSNYVFPVSLILDLEETAVYKAFPCDIGSPYGHRSAEIREKYLKQIATTNDACDLSEYLIRTYQDSKVSSDPGDTRDTKEKQETLDSMAVKCILSRTKPYSRPYFLYRGKIPSLSPAEVLRQMDHEEYNELIILGKSRNRVMGLLVEKSWVESAFKDEWGQQKKPRALDKDQRAVLTMLQTFTTEHPEVPLIMVNTSKMGHHKKLPLHRQLKPLCEEYLKVATTMSECMLKQFRLKQVGSPKLKEVTQELSQTVQELNEIHTQLQQVRALLTQKC